ncbi:GNAT family N-acetyltransferase [Rubellimicrobium sp. CFH 75288]|uniref:GNAT family N-acetyltransferase n=1 Tax=Rubellimicrobium sp. CFH 75288 TaxID=2697034 RepID=UPI0014122985|nr:GNAT family N-acetyltransferase [Rubellimicrobium sp. CFH 75288]NAZ36799.1 GNAT family N-acetyltransferase [Rubellimicrobium sp. CFH 75288]
MLESTAKPVAPPSAQPIIAAERFVLRPLRRSDAGLIAHYAGDPRVARNTRSIPHPYPPGAAEALVARSAAPDRGEDIWALDGSASGAGELLGLVCLKRMDRAQAEISFWIAPGVWGTGLATGAIGALVAANPQRCDALFAEVIQDNPGAARVLTNNGFEYLGDAETYCVARGQIVPTWTYALQLHP